MTGTQPRKGRHARPEPPLAVPPGPMSAVPLSPEALPQLADASLGDLVREAATHFSTLFRSEVELAKSEVTAEVRKGAKGSIFFVLALAIVLFSLFFLFITVAEVLAIWLPQWAGFAIVFGLMLAAAAVCALLGWRRVRSMRKPERTISTVRETGAALSRRRPVAAPLAADPLAADPLRE
ncbi:MAG: phage holin family protein [Pseudonocardiaceae bacterium]